MHHDDPEWCKRLTFRDYIDKGRSDAMSYQESFSKGYMYGHGMVAGLASSLYYARVAGVRDGDRRALARAISLVENGDSRAGALVQAIRTPPTALTNTSWS